MSSPKMALVCIHNRRRSYGPSELSGFQKNTVLGIAMYLYVCHVDLQHDNHGAKFSGLATAYRKTYSWVNWTGTIPTLGPYC